LLEVERPQRALVAIPHVRGDALRRLVIRGDPELDPQGIEVRKAPRGQELESPRRDAAATRLGRDDVTQLELPSFMVDPEGEAEPEKRPVVSVDDGECLPRAVATPLFVDLEPLTLPPGRDRVRHARVAEHVLVAEHRRYRGEMILAERLEAGVRQLIAEQGPDPLDRIEVLVAAQRERAAAVGERPVDREVETIVAFLHLRPVERTRATVGPDPTATRALPRRPFGPLLEEQQIDARVGGGLEGVRPAGGRTSAATRFLPPALDCLLLLLGLPFLEDRPSGVEQLGGRSVRFRMRPADDRILHLVREHLFEVCARLPRRHDDDPRTLQSPHATIELLVGQLLRGLRPLFTRVDERVDAARSVARSRRDAGIEIDVDADRAALFGTEARQLAKPVPIHGYSHLRLLLPESGDSKGVARD